ncbi:MAG TPA: hypothetical protein VF580_02925, partial [Thermoanaerobaculia bacterium]
MAEFRFRPPADGRYTVEVLARSRGESAAVAAVALARAAAAPGASLTGTVTAPEAGAASNVPVSWENGEREVALSR